MRVGEHAVTQAKWFVGAVTLAIAISRTASWFGETVVGAHSESEAVRQAATVAVAFGLIAVTIVSGVTVERMMRRRRGRASADT